MFLFLHIPLMALIVPSEIWLISLHFYALGERLKQEKTFTCIFIIVKKVQKATEIVHKIFNCLPQKIRSTSFQR